MLSWCRVKISYPPNLVLLILIFTSRKLILTSHSWWKERRMVFSGKKKTYQERVQTFMQDYIPGQDLLVICLGGVVRYPALCLGNDLGGLTGSFVSTWLGEADHSVRGLTHLSRSA